MSEGGPDGLIPYCPPGASAAARLRHDTAALDLIDRAKANGATWNTIGATLGMTGREAKRHAHKLRTRTRRAALLP